MTRPLTYAEAYSQAKAAGFEMLKYAGSSNAYGSVFRCAAGHEWATRHNNVVSSNKTGCPTCYAANRHFSEDEVRQKLAAEGRELVSLDSEIRGQKTLVTVRCGEGHLSQVKLGTIIYAKKPCAHCSRKIRGVDEEGVRKRLGKLGYRLVEWVSTRELATIACECGHSWSARLNSILQEQSHCPACFEKGFDGNAPAVFYLYALHKGRKLRYGYGISGQFPRRDREHRRNAKKEGWNIVLERVWEFDRGVKAFEIERKLKQELPAPSDTPKGFKTEAIMPRYLARLLATLTESDIFQPPQAQRKGRGSS